MKKFIKISLIAILLFIGINKVSARSCDDLVMYAESDFEGYLNGITLQYKNFAGNTGYNQYHYYTLKDTTGSAFSTYCRNPGRTAAKTKGSTTAYVCEEVVFDTSSSSETKKTYDAGILAILENGYSSRNNNTYPLNSSEEQLATTIALRSYEMLWQNLNSNTAPNSSCPTSGKNAVKNLYRAEIYYANKFLGDTEIKSLLQQAVGTVRSTIPCETPVDKITYNGADVKTAVENEAKRLIKIGLQGAINYKNNGAASVTYSGPTTTKLEENGSEYKKIDTYTFNVKNFKSSGSYVNLVFDCPTCTSLGVDYTIYINNTNVGKTISGNLLNYVTNGTGSFTVKIEFTRNADSSTCNSISYDLKLKYFDETVDTEAYSMKSKNCTNNTECQHFYMLYATDTEIEETISNSVEVCDCYELEDLCNAGNNKACTIIDKDYEGKCIKCTTELSNAECTKDDSEIDISEAHELNDKKCEISSEENILRCVINSEDSAGNSYKSDLISNKYCSVWCKEDYHLTLPGQEEANSGRYFSLKASISGAKTCYTSEIMDYDEFVKNDLEEKRTAVVSAYGTWNSSKNTQNQNKLNAAISDYVNTINDYNSCSGINTINYNNELNKTTSNGWISDYNYNPEVKFWYEEKYMDSADTNVLDTIGNVKIGDVTQSVCLGDTNDAYSSCTTGWVSNEDLTENTSQYVCKKSGNGYECGNYSVFVSKAKYVKQTIEASGSYITPTQFYTIYPTGAIAITTKKDANVENASPLVNSLPIGLGTKSGVYNYTIVIDNLGEFYNSDKLGRIWGSENSVVSAILDEENKCQQTGALQKEYGEYDSGVYVCSYKVNCPDCPVVCEEDGCYWKDCPDNSCPVVCEDCAFSNNDSNINYRPITSDDINPNDRELGSNWASDDSIDTALELKAHVTTEEIETHGDTIYDIDYSNSGEGYAMEVTLDSKTISKIRDYNDKYEDEGYLNNSLKCYDHVNSNDGKTYKNVYCYSTFIDELLYDKDTKDNIKVTKNRIIGTNASSTDKLRKTNTQSSGYWTTWSEATSSNWTITTEKVLYYKSNYVALGIGPSWK